MGFTLQGFVPIPRPNQGFPRNLRSCASAPNRMAWRRRSSGLRSRGQRHPPALPPSSGENGDPALLSFRTFQVCFHRTFEEVSSFLVPLAPFSSRPPKKPGNGASGDSFRWLGVSPLSRGADLPGVPDRRPLPPFWNANPSRPIFSARNPRDSHEPREDPLCDRFHPA